MFTHTLSQFESMKLRVGRVSAVEIFTSVKVVS